MKYWSIIIFLFLAPFIVKSQHIPKFVIVDIDNKKPVNFANVRIKNTEKGTYSNESGEFELSVNQYDTLEVSCVGYISNSNSVQSIKDSIFLKSTNIILPEVIITTDEANDKPTLGLFNHKVKMEIGGLPASETAVWINNTAQKNSKIKYIHIKAKKGDKNGAFKVHLYSIDKKTSMPDQDLLPSNVVYYSDNIKKKSIQVDISKLNIVIPQAGVFVGIEWLGQIDKNSNMLLTQLKRGTFPEVFYTVDLKESLTWHRNQFSNSKWISLQSYFGQSFNFGKNPLNACFGLTLED
jgi:hypothetical protein